MNYELEFKVFGDSKKLYDCFQPEILEGNRANVELKKKDDHLLFKIKAKDSVALRAIINSITKLLTVYEKMVKV
jgi:tRNA threonylcarbamoyladenosine modification (KEOPS) complex  Pcc1 subunit